MAAEAENPKNLWSTMKILGTNRQCDIGALVLEDCNSFAG
jgi:regulator of ribosome biosynthesis